MTWPGPAVGEVRWSLRVWAIYGGSTALGLVGFLLLYEWVVTPGYSLWGLWAAIVVIVAGAGGAALAEADPSIGGRSTKTPLNWYGKARDRMVSRAVRAMVLFAGVGTAILAMPPVLESDTLRRLGVIVLMGIFVGIVLALVPGYRHLKRGEVGPF